MGNGQYLTIPVGIYTSVFCFFPVPDQAIALKEMNYVQDAFTTKSKTLPQAIL
jgi:hypothetical protein